MAAETVIASGALVVGVVLLVRAIVTSQQGAARKKTRRELERAWQDGRASPMEGAKIGEFLVESLSEVAAVDYAKDPHIRRLTANVLTVARERQEAWLSEVPERHPR
jgi:hypothetical protein